MTKEETAKLLAIISTTYPNYKVENKAQTLEAWAWALEDFPYEAIQMSFKIYLRSDKSGFAPSVNQLITGIQKPNEMNTLSDGEAWALVKKAIQNGNYGAEEEFNKLPELVQKSVGSPNMIRQWAMCDTSEVNTVIASNFQKTYRTIVARNHDRVSISPQLLDMAKVLADKLTYNNPSQLAIESEE